MADLIFSRKANDTTLTDQDIMRMAPAAFADTQADHLSDRYGQVTTADAIGILADYGFAPVQAAQVQTRKASRDHAAHLIAFAPTSGDVSTDGTRGELILYNSHDGQSSLKLFAGAYRFICSNGIVAGDGFDARLRHTKGTVSNFEDMLRDTAASLPDLMGRIERMQSVQVDPMQALDFAYNAATLRWEWLGADAPESGLYADKGTLVSMLRPTRYGDQSNDAWTVYNRVQESLVRGGAKVRSFTEKNPHGAKRKARPIGSVSGVVKTNRELWDLATECGLVAA
jgi:hypothetical protein